MHMKKSTCYLLCVDESLSDINRKCGQHPAGVILCSKCAVLLITWRCFLLLELPRSLSNMNWVWSNEVRRSTWAWRESKIRALRTANYSIRFSFQDLDCISLCARNSPNAPADTTQMPQSPSSHWCVFFFWNLLRCWAWHQTWWSDGRWGVQCQVLWHLIASQHRHMALLPVLITQVALTVLLQPHLSPPVQEPSQEGRWPWASYACPALPKRRLVEMGHPEDTVTSQLLPTADKICRFECYQIWAVVGQIV